MTIPVRFFSFTGSRFLINSAFILIILFLKTSNVDANIKTWSTSYPVVGSVTIPYGETLLLDTNLNLDDLIIFGTVICADKDLYIQSYWILVKGNLECGNSLKPFQNQLEITLLGNNSSENISGLGTKFIGAIDGGSIQFTGTPRSITWTRLALTAKKGSSKINVQGKIDWKVGEKIVISSSDYRFDHAEEVNIAKISGNVIYLSEPLSFNHWCQKEVFGQTWSMTECSEVGLLSRNILIQGDSDSEQTGFGGHIIVTSGSSAKIDGAELFRLGQKGIVGRYPMHWHMVGNASGQYLSNSSIHHAFNRFATIHGTHQVKLERNVGYDTTGHGFYLEDGIEEKNIISGNLGLVVKNSLDGKPTFSDKRASVFWISNPNNFVRSNIAAGSANTGFWLGFPEHPIGLSSTDAIWPNRTPLAEFSDNSSHSNDGRGLFVGGGELPNRTLAITYYEPRMYPEDKNSALVSPVFKNFTSYKNRQEGMWIGSFSSPVITGAKLADNWLGIYLASLVAAPINSNVGIIRNSLIVGESKNLGNPEIWEAKGLDGREVPHFWLPHDSIRGVQYYHGPMAVVNSVFANFQSNNIRNSGALTNLSSHFFWMSSKNYAEKLGFLNANHVYIHDFLNGYSGDAFSTIIDKDGSISGKVGGVIVPKNPLLITSNCTFKDSWNAYVCPHDYVNLRVINNSQNIQSEAVIQRIDGAKFNLSIKDNIIRANLLVNIPHKLTFLNGGTPNHLSFVVSEKAGKPIRISIPYSTSSFTITRWGIPIERASNLSELTTGDKHKFYYDGINLHLRLIGKDERWDVVEIKAL
jgi:G8 domain